MYRIEIKTHNGYEKVVKFIDKEYAMFCFNNFIEAIDAAYVVMTDGLTGELLIEFKNGKLELFS